MNEMIKRLTAFRRELHQYPELSGNEEGTAKRILDFLGDTLPGEVHTGIGGHGLLLVYDSGKPGKTILLRGDMDALPIDEPKTLPHHSTVPGVSHKCGHDGHTAILAGVVLHLHENPPKNGKIVLLFQPAEETGAGAEAVIKELPSHLNPDLVFGFHNLPGEPLNSIIIKEKWFASASHGMIIRFTGKKSHAAEPEKGINPAFAMAEIATWIKTIPLQQYQKATIIHLSVGEVAFGTSPGEGVMMLTLRAGSTEAMEELTKRVTEKVDDVASREKVDTEISFTEVFPATESHHEANVIISKSAENLNLKLKKSNVPFSWSEDFGHFTMRYPGAMFGIGAGEECPNLHNDAYDFRDELIEVGVEMLLAIVSHSSPKLREERKLE